MSKIKKKLSQQVLKYTIFSYMNIGWNFDIYKIYIISKTRVKPHRGEKKPYFNPCYKMKLYEAIENIILPSVYLEVWWGPVLYLSPVYDLN